MSLTKCEHVVAPKGGKYCSYDAAACVVCITGTTKCNNYYGAALNGVKIAITSIQFQQEIETKLNGKDCEKLQLRPDLDL